MELKGDIFALCTENDTNSIVITDDTGIIQYINKKFTEVTGYYPIDVIGKHTRILKSGETPDSEYKLLWEIISSGRMWTGQFHNKKKNGVFFWEEAKIIPYIENGVIVSYIAIKTDITDKKIVSELIKGKQKFVDRITATNPNVIYIFDIIENYFVYINSQVSNLIGYTKSEIEDMDSTDLKNIIYNNDLPNIVKYHENIRNQTNGRIYECEYRMIHKNGNIRWVLSRDSIFEFENKIPKLIVGTVIDITQNKLYQQSLEESNSTKDKLFSIISHDLRNPFNSLLGYIEMIYSDINSLSKSDIKKFSHELLNISKNLNTLLCNLLDWSKIQSNRIVIDNIKINLLDFVNYIFDMVRFISESKKIKLMADIDPNININVDEKMIFSILYNLISNSIKFTNIGGNITISAYKGNFISSDRINISVIDDGIGIKYDDMGRLFKFDNQYTTYGTNNERGSGLGLIISKEFIELLGGKIEVKSEINKGTEIIFDVKLNNN